MKYPLLLKWLNSPIWYINWDQGVSTCFSGLFLQLGPEQANNIDMSTTDTQYIDFVATTPVVKLSIC